MTKDWRSRIVGHGQEDPTALVPNELKPVSSHLRAKRAHMARVVTVRALAAAICMGAVNPNAIVVP